MLTRITACFLSLLFLMGSVFLPLGDFSLIRDLPKMYGSYEKLAAPEEVGVIDFIGDYLFAGKALLGHNKSDKPENSDISVQFQHSPSTVSFVYSKPELPYLYIKDFKITYTQSITSIETTDFHPELFRPPLV
jgi:hypothetical protein